MLEGGRRGFYPPPHPHPHPQCMIGLLKFLYYGSRMVIVLDVGIIGESKEGIKCFYLTTQIAWEETRCCHYMKWRQHVSSLFIIWVRNHMLNVM